MTNKATEDLIAAAGLDGTELFHVVDADGNSRKMTLAELKTFVNTDPTIVPSSEPWRGCRVYRTTDQTAVASGATISWEAEAIDTDAIWTLGVPTRLTVPVGVTKIRLRWGVAYEAMATAGSLSSTLTKNGAAMAVPDHYARSYYRSGATGFTNNAVQGNSSTLTVVGGDYFQLLTSFSMAGQDQVLANIGTFFEMEIVEG